MTAGADLHWVGTGTGPNVLLVSGLNGQARFWQPVIDRLSTRFRMVAFDQRGCGASPDDGARWSIETMAQDAMAVAQAAFGQAPFAVVGHSTGGAIAQVMAARAAGGRISAIVLSGTWRRTNPYFRALFEFRLALLDRAPELDPILSTLLRNSPPEFTAPDGRVALDVDVTRRRIYALLDDWAPPLGKEDRAPLLIIATEDDRIVPVSLSHDLAATLGTADLATRPEGGHFFPQTRTDWFCITVGGWLEAQLDENASGILGRNWQSA